MEVYESPLHSLMAGELFQSGLIFDAYVIIAISIGDVNYKIVSKAQDIVIILRMINNKHKILYFLIIAQNHLW